MYVCGVTPYDSAHLGHGRSSIAFDVLYRTLLFLGYDVVYCRNFTDIDDKLINKSLSLFQTPHRYPEIAQHFIKEFHDAMAAFDCNAPDYEPLVTAHIGEIIRFIERLIETGHAYEAAGSVYFNINSFPEYGHLSRQNITQLRSGTRSQVEPEKHDPLDFALWKKEDDGTFWHSPWGYGRPGWHIECSALASHYLGEQIDIHGGGLDLIFPHHENEIAQTQSLTHKPLANYWLHNGMVKIDGEKMSKSLGNFITLNDLLAQHNPMVLRFYFLNHHYRAPLDFSIAGLETIKKAYTKLARIFDHRAYQPLTNDEVKTSTHVQNMLAFLTDDLNTVGLMGYLFEHAQDIAANNTDSNAVQQFLLKTLGLTLEPLAQTAVEVTPEIEDLLAQREQARNQKQWARADEIRDILVQKGYQVQDKKL